MTEQTLLRFAMILQNQAPSTLNKYICKLSEAILFDHPEGMSALALSGAIRDQFSLSFTPDEVRHAVEMKGKPNIGEEEKEFFLQDAARRKLTTDHSLFEDLNKVCEKFVGEDGSEQSPDAVSTLLERYLYYCFNSNVDNLLSLFNLSQSDNKGIIHGRELDLSDEEIAVIDRFIAWDDEEKDQLVYKIVSACYDYCMLTIKKDINVSKDLFRGKRFYLDANVIFRVAGINREDDRDRQAMTKSFFKHCQNVGIELYCTGATMDEVYRVISAQIGFVRSICGDSMPVDPMVLRRLNSAVEINDFYIIYYDWCRGKENQHGDYEAFGKYLLDLVQQVIFQLKIKGSGNYWDRENTDDLFEQAQSLMEYKNTKRTTRRASLKSAETDVTNILDVLKQRGSKGEPNIWQTNDFLVSADYMLVNWANRHFYGVPIVVLPSAWLSIILRFTGRADDDYKAFCRFLTQRYHNDLKNVVDPMALLRVLNLRTTNTQLQERIVVELTQDKSVYRFESDDDYEVNIDRAFDKVMEEANEKSEQEAEKLRAEMRTSAEKIEELKRSAEQFSEILAINASASQATTVTVLAKKQAFDKVRPFRKAFAHTCIYYIIGAAILLLGFFTWSLEWEPLYSWMISLFPSKIANDVGNQGTALTALTTIGGLLIAGLGGLLRYLGSTKRENKLFEKYFHELMDMLSTNPDEGKDGNDKG